MHTKDLTRAILLAVIVFVTHSWVGQIPYLVTGIPGIGYYLIIVHTILYGVAALLFQGRRWRMVFMTALMVVLTMPLHLGGPPYDIVTRLPILTSIFFYDLIFNSLYGMFRRKNQLALWAISGVTFHFVFGTLLDVPINFLFYGPEVVETIFNIVATFLPVIFVESIVGAYLGYLIYRRVESIV
jgi:hypothetical protein